MKNPIRIAVNESVNQAPYARRTLTKLFSGMIKYPSESKAQTLEDMGYSVDYTNQDVGEAPERHNFDR